MTTAAPPRPRANPLLGSALDLRRSRIRTYVRMMREYGDAVRLAVGPPGVRFELYCVFHPDGVKAVLAGSRESYSKGTRFYRQIAEAFGWGLLTSEGELWLRQRGLIQPLFTRGRPRPRVSGLVARRKADRLHEQPERRGQLRRAHDACRGRQHHTADLQPRWR
jgi:cytochrome P450